MPTPSATSSLPWPELAFRYQFDSPDWNSVKAVTPTISLYCSNLFKESCGVEQSTVVITEALDEEDLAYLRYKAQEIERKFPIQDINPEHALEDLRPGPRIDYGRVQHAEICFDWATKTIALQAHCNSELAGWAILFARVEQDIADNSCKIRIGYESVQILPEYRGLGVGHAFTKILSEVLGNWITSLCLPADKPQTVEIALDGVICSDGGARLIEQLAGSLKKKARTLCKKNHGLVFECDFSGVIDSRP